MAKRAHASIPGVGEGPKPKRGRKAAAKPLSASASAPVTEEPFDYNATLPTLEEAAQWGRPPLSSETLALIDNKMKAPDGFLFQLTACRSSYVKPSSVPASVRSIISTELDAQVPVVRLYGVTEQGHSCCVNVWNFSPYFFINTPEGATHDAIDIEELANELDKAVGKQQKQRFNSNYQNDDDLEGNWNQDYKRTSAVDPFDSPFAASAHVDPGAVERMQEDRQKQRQYSMMKRSDSLLGGGGGSSNDTLVPFDKLASNRASIQKRSDQPWQGNAPTERYYVQSLDPVSYILNDEFQFDKTPLLRVNMRVPNLVTTLRSMVGHERHTGLDTEQGTIHGPTFESGVRFETRFMIDHGMVGSGWVRVNGPFWRRRRDESQHDTRCQIELDADHGEVLGVDIEKESAIYNKKCRMRVHFRDGEMLGREGIFPVPECDPVILIHSIIAEVDDLAHPIASVSFCLGSLPKNVNVSKTHRAVCFENEADLLKAWGEFIKLTDPDIESGYNTKGFDAPYFHDRAQVLGIQDYLFSTRLKDKSIEKREKVRHSKNLGNRKSWLCPSEGRVEIDMMQYMQDNHKLRSYSLNSVSNEFLHDQKEDVNHKMIPILFRGSPDDRLRLKTYCEKDADLPRRLMIELRVMVGMFELSRAQGVQLEEQQDGMATLKVFVGILKQARADDIVIPYIPNQVKQDFTGANVFEPSRGFYKKPVIILDYMSLYPSEAIAHNLCNSTRVSKKRIEEVAARLGGHDKLETCPEGVTYVRASVRKGIIPKVLERLLARRAEVKKLMAATKDPVLKQSYNGRQEALKITANSTFGATSVPNNGTYWQEVGASITAYGREQILMSRDTVENEFKMERGYIGTAKVLYGDSVTGDTPVLVRYPGCQPMLCTIDSLADETDWEERSAPWLERVAPKEQVDVMDKEIDIWTDKGWCRLKRVIRHATNKAIYRVNTHTGSVCVTADHSLLRPDGSICRPTEVMPHMALLHHAYPSSSGTCNAITSVDEAFAMGFFFADGSCGSYVARDGAIKNTWAINKQDLQLLRLTEEKLNGLTEEERCGCTFKILDTLQSSGVYKLVASGRPRDLCAKYRQLFYHPTSKLKVVPPAIIHAKRDVREAFWKGYYAGDGDHVGPGERCDIKGQIGAAGMFWLLKTLNYNVSINIRDDKPDIYRLTLTKNKMRKVPIDIKKIHLMSPASETTLMVYDLETENHHFSAGVGELVVHNTDSIMIDFGIDIPDWNDTEEVSYAMRLATEYGEKAAALCTAKFAPPNKLQLECIIAPFLLMNKKRYGGLIWASPFAKWSSRKLKGVESVRRDNCRHVARTQERCLDIIFKDMDPDAAIAYASRQIGLLRENKVDIYDLIISGQLSKEGKEYKNPQAHAHVADLIKRRSPGSEPHVGDRVPYVIVTAGKESKRYEKAEDPSYAVDNDLDIDMDYYVNNQMWNPLQRIFEPIFGPKETARRLNSKENNKRIVKIGLEEKGLLKFFGRQVTCYHCHVTLPLHSEEEKGLLCHECDKNRLDISEHCRRDLAETQREFSRIWTNCQSCQGSFHKEVICSATDCPVYFKRQVLARDLKKINQQFKALTLDW